MTVPKVPNFYIGHLCQKDWLNQFLDGLILFPMCQNGELGIGVFLLLCMVHILWDTIFLNAELLLLKCSFSALKIEVATFVTNIDHTA